MKKMQHWTDLEIQYLHDNYKTQSFNDIAIALNRSTASISHKLQRLKLTTVHLWSDNDITFLINNYATVPYEILEKVLNRSKTHIKSKATALKIKRKRLSDLSFLLDNSLISFYWIGFILADGFFNHNSFVNSSFIFNNSFL